ncbi:hypothetical protein [Nocardia spumae]|uniref:hypothetical protein n=1 Tax=Nocardia spumae TaxID=2887190 RepID=UPI001D14EB2C|nr:hypothetical protein [Nocardia spumae]
MTSDVDRRWQVRTADTDRRGPLDYSDFSVVRDLLRTRLYGTTSLGDGVRRVIAPGLVQRVVIDRPHTVVPVTYDMLARWPIGEWELFELAEQHVRGDGGVHIVRDRFDRLPWADDLPRVALLTGPEYLTAHARWLGDHAIGGPEGAVLTMPSKEAIYAYPVLGAEVVRSIELLALLAALHTADPWPINSHVYWWRPGSLELAATTRQREDTIVISPTDVYRRNLARFESGESP